MSKKILIVEDNRDLNDMYKISFEKKGYEVEICEDGMSAMQHLDTFQPDVVLLDIMMPFVSGFDFLKAVRTKGNTVKIIVNSNLSQDSDVKRAMDCGADEYLKKADVTPSEVVEKVDEVML